jgi:hypothetical protein
MVKNFYANRNMGFAWNKFLCFKSKIVILLN